jgi:tRNA(fMet)-specific endonuclease VapC
MLDTDTVSYWFRDAGRVRENVDSHGPPELRISAITLAELRFGAVNRNAAKLHQLIDDFISEVIVVAFDDRCTIEYALVANGLANAGKPIGYLDTLIAAHAKTLDLTLVTNNVKHFSRVPGLRVENWL